MSFQANKANFCEIENKMVVELSKSVVDILKICEITIRILLRNIDTKAVSDQMEQFCNQN